MKGKDKVAIYCRLSEEDRNKKNPGQNSESIENQIMLLTQYANEQDWEIYHCYSDDDWAGTDRSRPAFNRMLTDAREGRFQIILCKTQSRFTREMELVEKYIHGLFPLWGIRFVSVVDNADSNVQGNKKSRQINGLVNEWYLEDMSENIKAVLNTRREEGYYIGSVPLYGYRKDPERKGHLLIDSEAAEVVHLIFSSFASGMGKTAIARMLNEKGIPNPTEYKRLRGILQKRPLHQRGTLWNYYSIADMLGNEMYIGNLIQGKYGSISYKNHKNKPKSREEWIRVENTHEPIIEKPLWEVVQQIRRERTRPFSDGFMGIFARKVRCSHCGYTMRSCKSHNRYYLKCNTRHLAREACIGSFIPVIELEKVILENLKEMNEKYLDKKDLLDQIVLNDEDENMIESLEKRKNTSQYKIKQLEQAMKNLYLDKVKEEITAEEFRLLFHQLEEDKRRIIGQKAEVDNKLKVIREKRKCRKNKETVIEEYINVSGLNRMMVEKFIDYIEVSKRDAVTKDVLVKIHWNF